jgi:Sulfotransferase family
MGTPLVVSTHFEKNRTAASINGPTAVPDTSVEPSGQQTHHSSERNETESKSNPDAVITTLNDPEIYLPVPRDSSYSWSQQDRNSTLVGLKPLGFLHIPKTGGSSIEHAAADAGVVWGMCLFSDTQVCKHHHHQQHPKEPTNQTTIPLFDPAWKNSREQETNPFYSSMGTLTVPLWHLPIQHLPSYPSNAYYDANLTDPYRNQDVFVVVRNPYKRALSEYYYACQFGGCFSNDTASTKGDTAQTMNKILQQILIRNHRFIWSGGSRRSRTKSNDETTQSTLPAPHKRYFQRAGHWIPQYDYVYSMMMMMMMNGNDTIIQHAQHVIHFEHLQEEFASLMAAYNLSHVNLTAVGKQLSRTQWNTRQTVADLYPRTRKLIEDIFELDFQLGGGYVMIERTKEARSDPAANSGFCNVSDGQSLYVVGSKVLCM